MTPRPEDDPPVIRCAGCSRPWKAGEHGWRSYLTDDESPAVLIFCPKCAEEEFRD